MGGSRSQANTTNTSITTVGDIGFTGAQGVQFVQALGNSAAQMSYIQSQAGLEYEKLRNDSYKSLTSSLSNFAGTTQPFDAKPIYVGFAVLSILMLLKR